VGWILDSLVEIDIMNYFSPLEVLHQRDLKSLWNGKFHIMATTVDRYTHMIVATNENEIANVPYVMILTRLDIVYVVNCKIRFAK